MQDKEEKPVLVVLPAEVVQDRSQLVPEVGSTQWPAQLMLLGSVHCTSSSLNFSCCCGLGYVSPEVLPWMLLSSRTRAGLGPEVGSGLAWHVMRQSQDLLLLQAWMHHQGCCLG